MDHGSGKFYKLMRVGHDLCLPGVILKHGISRVIYFLLRTQYEHFDLWPWLLFLASPCTSYGLQPVMMDTYHVQTRSKIFPFCVRFIKLCSTSHHFVLSCVLSRMVYENNVQTHVARGTYGGILSKGMPPR